MWRMPAWYQVRRWLSPAAATIRRVRMARQGPAAHLRWASLQALPGMRQGIGACRQH